MKGVNKVILVATLGNDPEIRYTQNGGAVANFTAATNEKWTDKQTGELHESTEWHRLSAFGRTAEIIGEYLTKGSQVYVEGKLQTRKWQDNNGVDRYTTEILVRDLQMLGGGNNGGQQQQQRPQQQRPQQQRGGQQQQRPQQQRGGQQQRQQQNYPNPDNGHGAGDGYGGSDFGDFDDDIPF